MPLFLFFFFCVIVTYRCVLLRLQEQKSFVTIKARIIGNHHFRELTFFSRLIVVYRVLELYTFFLHYRNIIYFRFEIIYIKTYIAYYLILH